MSTPQDAALGPKKRTGSWVLSILGIVVAVALIGLPYLIKSEAIKWLRSHGAVQARIGDIDLNLFAGTFQLDDLVVETGSGTPLRIAQLGGDIRMLDLLARRAVVQSLWLYGGHLSVTQGEDGALSVGGIRLPGAPPAAEATSSEKTNWMFGLNTFVLADTTVSYHAPDLAQHIHINVVYVLDMHSWEPDRPARVGIDMRINDQPFTITSGVRAFAADPDLVAELELEGLDLAGVAALAGRAGIGNLAGKASFKLALDAVQQAAGRRLGIRGDVVLRDLRADYAESSITQGLLHYAGTLRIRLQERGDAPIAEMEGLLESRDGVFTGAGLEVRHGGLSWRTAAKVFAPAQDDGAWRVHAQGGGGIDSLTVDGEARLPYSVDIRRIDIEGADIRLPERAAVEAVTVGETTAGGVVRARPGLPHLSFKRLHLGKSAYDFTSQSGAIAAAELEGLGVRDNARDLVLADVGRVTVGQVALDNERGVSVARIDISDLHALRPASKGEGGAPAVLSVGGLASRNLSYTLEPSRIDIEVVELGRLTGRLIREADGSLYGMAQLLSPTDANAEPPSAPQGADPGPAGDEPPTIRLGFLEITDGEIHWTDNKVKPRVNLTVRPLSLALGAIDTAAPAAETSVELQASLHDHNEIAFTGYVSPLDPKPNARLDGRIKGLNLTTFSAYAAAGGYTLRSGRLDAEIAATVTDGELDMLNKLEITKLQLEGAGGDARRDATSGAAALPLNVALGYLRDKDDRIRLDVPVTGNLRDPKFNFNDVIRLATQSAAQKTAMNYLTQALQPLGTVLLIGKLAQRTANALQFQSIAFAPGDAALDETAQAYLEKIARILNGRPGIRLTICGTATESDRAALLAGRAERERTGAAKDLAEKAAAAELRPTVGDDELLELAAQRSGQVRDLLVTGHGVDPDQLFDCRPVVEGDPGAAPGVALGI